MTNKTPIFPMLDSQHYSDYGFDPQIDYFQILEEARKQNKRWEARPLDTLHFKLQKPISKDDHRSKTKKRRWWWKTALLFWKRTPGDRDHDQPKRYSSASRGAASSRPPVSGPIYLTESPGSNSPCRTSRPSSGPLPYFNLRELNLVEGHRNSSSAAAALAMPIYLVT